MPDALTKRCAALVSIGNVQSNRQVAGVAPALGLNCLLVKERWTDWKDPVHDKVGNALLCRLMGAKLVFEVAGYSTAIKATQERSLDQVRREGGMPYPIPAGASDHPLGGFPW
jgi:1-aminocyclopropane-1-carboxylate deaminase